MADFLSDEWFAEMANACTHVNSSSSSTVEDERALAIEEHITDTPHGDVTYVMCVASHECTILPPSSASSQLSPRPDVRFRQSYDTAVALHKGELTLQEAFFAGRIRVRGKIHAMLDHAELLQGLSAHFADVRARTTYPVVDTATSPATSA